MIITVISWIAGIYAGLIVLFYFLQDLAFFRPEILPHNFQYKYAFPFEEKHFEMDDGGTINGIHFKIPNALGVVYYLKGNSRSIKGWGKFARDFVGKGYDFFMVDYRGFGKSKGKRTENTLYSDAQYIYKWLQQHYNEENIVVFGRSFGSGVATKVAAWNNPKMLILDSPYYGFKELVKQQGGFILPLKYLLKYKIPSYKFIKKVNCAVHIIHGNRDRLIPYDHGKKLTEENPEKTTLYTIQKGGHNNLPSFPEFHDYLYKILTE